MYLPHYPSGESSEQQEQQRLKILSELKKRERVAINQLMSNTFAHRRQDVVSLQLSIKEIKERWPALFDMSQVRKKSPTQFNANAPWVACLNLSL